MAERSSIGVKLLGLAFLKHMADDERPTKMRKLSHDDTAEHAYGKPTNGFEQEVEHDVPNQEETLTGNGAVMKTGRGSIISGEPSNDAAVNHDVPSEADQDDDLPPPDDTAPLANTDEVVADGPAMSKNQLKKLRKKQEWESKRDERKIIRKEKLVAKRERKREARKQDLETLPDAPSQPVQKPKWQQPRAVQLPVTILIDCDFDDLMRDNERISLGSQITRCYSDNKGAPFRAHLAVCSFGGELRRRFDSLLSHYKGWRGVRFVDENFVDAAEQAKAWMDDEKDGGKLARSFSSSADTDLEKLREEGEVVYLSSEATDTLTELKPYSTYIIGGLVDKNREKGICYKRAVRAGVKTAKLPIGEYLQMTSRKVLATNHVNEIMLEWLRCGDWGEAFMKVIPKRKGGQLRGTRSVEVEDGVDGAGNEGSDDDRDAKEHNDASAMASAALDGPPDVRHGGADGSGDAAGDVP